MTVVRVPFQNLGTKGLIDGNPFGIFGGDAL